MTVLYFIIDVRSLHHDEFSYEMKFSYLYQLNIMPHVAITGLCIEIDFEEGSWPQ